MSSKTRQHRTERITVRLTPADRRLIEQRAGECALAPSSYLREVGLGAVPRARPDAANAEALYQLARIGNNLNQLARTANALQRVDLGRRLDRVLEELRAALGRLV